MKTYKIMVELRSPTLIGSGEGWSSIIDTDVIYDDIGLPYFPARNCKGILRESALEVVEMFSEAGIHHFNNALIDQIFGVAGSVEGGLLSLGNLYLPDYSALYAWCKWATLKCSEIVSASRIIDTLTIIKEMTSINADGTAKEGSLRKARAIKPGLRFEGECQFAWADPLALKLVSLACLNIRHIGSYRHRGFGEVVCNLYQGEENLSQKTLTAIREEAV